MPIMSRQEPPSDTPWLWIQPGHSELIVNYYRHWTGRDLLPTPVADVRIALYTFKNPVLSHGIETDPVLNYGNQVALTLWEMDWAQLTATPSRLTAEAQNREARQRLLDEVQCNGYTDNYSGVRISRHGKRFLIKRATVWNLINDAGVHCGQAATFDSWEPLS